MKIQWEYDIVERPFCEQLKLMGWQWIEGDKDVPDFTGRANFRDGASRLGLKFAIWAFAGGSCGKHGVVFFNWKVLQLPVRLVDYIITHELVHLREGHHGPAFWDALGRAMPEWQKRKESLAGNAKDYLVFGLAV